MQTTRCGVTNLFSGSGKTVYGFAETVWHLKEISAALFQTEMNNLQILGYGAKAFTISMVETALQISNGRLQPTLFGKLSI